MNVSWAIRVALVVLACGAAVVAALVEPAKAEPAASAPAAKTVAGTLETRVVINRFTAVGRRVVGRGTAISTFRGADGTTTVTRKPFRVTVAQRPTAPQQEELCHILFLELDELDLTLLGLRVFLRAANPDESIQLKLQARRSGGVLGRLFCDLAQGSLATRAKAVAAARTMTRNVRGTVMQAQATLYAASDRTGQSFGERTLQQETEMCDVLHLILGPLHLDLLGLIVDLNKIALDIFAIPGTLLGDLFCSLGGGPPPPAGQVPGMPPGEGEGGG